jgi:DNA-binding SARP family transcriptional activator
MPGRVPALEARLLGRPRFTWDGVVLRFPTHKSLALAAHLAVRREGVDRAELAELLWTTGSPANLRPELHRLRALPGADAWLAAGEVVSLRVETDLVRFERAIRSGRPHDALRIHPEDALLLRGVEPRGASAFDDWLAGERARVERLLRESLRSHALALERSGDLAGALRHLRRLLVLDPLDESAYRAAMRCEYRRDRVEAAIAQYEACRRVLADELGADPLPETSALAAAIQAGATLPEAPRPRPRRPIPFTLLRPPTLVGREAPWRRMEEAWDAGRTINVSGAAGIGKSRLVLDFARAHGRSFVFDGRPGDHVVPFSSLARATRAAHRAHPGVYEGAPAWVRVELARIVPDLGEPSPPPVDDASLARFFEAFVMTMDALRSEVDAIVIDDLQYLDAKSFEVGLAAQARLLAEESDPGRARLLSAYRTGTLPQAFEHGLALAVDAGLAVHVVLGPLDRADLGRMVDTLDVGLTADAADQLHHLTGGNPQFVVEALKALHEADETTAVVALEERSGPPSEAMVSIILRRIDALGSRNKRVAQAIAVLDRPADPELLVRVLGLAGLDVAEALDELERAQVLQGGVFVHDVLHDVTYASLPAGLRRWLHGRVAAVLHGRADDPHRIAYHREAATSAA